MAILCLCNFLLAGKPFVVGKLTGQLGNQMFVIAATVSLALDHGAEPLFPDLINRTDNNIPINYKKLFYHLNTKNPRKISTIYKEPHFHYAPIPYVPNMKIVGYFQSDKYFRHHKEEIIELFAPPPEIEAYLQKKYGEIIDHPKTVSVHMRSYLKEDPSQSIYLYCGREYLEQAILQFPEDALFLVFSNDMELCKKEIGDIPRTLYFVEGEEHYNDIYLMSKCKHNIISNSSYSWWGAYLNRNPEKIVVAPQKWFSENSGINEKDIIPEEWICYFSPVK